MKRVVMVQGMLKHYRVPLHVALHKYLGERGVDYRVVYGTPFGEERSRRDTAEMTSPPGYQVKTIWMFANRLAYQHVAPYVRDADLVILEQANRFVMNYYYLATRRLRSVRLAYFGHGRNLQASTSNLSERWKRLLLRRVDWWFAYTRGVSEYLRVSGFPRDRISVVQNSIDTKTFRDQLYAVDEASISQHRAALGWDGSEFVAVFCGSLHADKRLDLLFAAARLTRQGIPRFRLLIIGAGPLEPLVRQFVREESWVAYVGSKYGAERAALFRLGSVYLCPGLIGLGILDAYVAGLPVITTDVPVHSPEIEYLEHGHTGFMVTSTPEAVAEVLGSLVAAPAEVRRLSTNARTAAEQYSMESMVRNFGEGILKCLEKS